jgi:hypothetical protein
MHCTQDLTHKKTRGAQDCVRAVVRAEQGSHYYSVVALESWAYACSGVRILCLITGCNLLLLLVIAAGHPYIRPTCLPASADVHRTRALAADGRLVVWQRHALKTRCCDKRRRACGLAQLIDVTGLPAEPCGVAVLHQKCLRVSHCTALSWQPRQHCRVRLLACMSCCLLWL